MIQGPIIIAIMYHGYSDISPGARPAEGKFCYLYP